MILRRALWGVLYGVLGAVSTAIARRAATSIWHIATGEEPPLKR